MKLVRSTTLPGHEYVLAAALSPTTDLAAVALSKALLVLRCEDQQDETTTTGGATTMTLGSIGAAAVTSVSDSAATGKGAPATASSAGGFSTATSVASLTSQAVVSLAIPGVDYLSWSPTGRLLCAARSAPMNAAATHPMCDVLIVHVDLGLVLRRFTPRGWASAAPSTSTNEAPCVAEAVRRPMHAGGGERRPLSALWWTHADLPVVRGDARGSGRLPGDAGVAAGSGVGSVVGPTLFPWDDDRCAAWLTPTADSLSSDEAANFAATTAQHPGVPLLLPHQLALATAACRETATVGKLSFLCVLDMSGTLSLIAGGLQEIMHVRCVDAAPWPPLRSYEWRRGGTGPRVCPVAGGTAVLRVGHPSCVSPPRGTAEGADPAHETAAAAASSAPRPPTVASLIDLWPAIVEVTSVRHVAHVLAADLVEVALGCACSAALKWRQLLNAAHSTLVAAGDARYLVTSDALRPHFVPLPVLDVVLAAPQGSAQKLAPPTASQLLAWCDALYVGLDDVLGSLTQQAQSALGCAMQLMASTGGGGAAMVISSTAGTSSSSPPSGSLQTQKDVLLNHHNSRSEEGRGIGAVFALNAFAASLASAIGDLCVAASEERREWALLLRWRAGVALSGKTVHPGPVARREPTAAVAAAIHAAAPPNHNAQPAAAGGGSGAPVDSFANCPDALLTAAELERLIDDYDLFGRSFEGGADAPHTRSAALSQQLLRMRSSLRAVWHDTDAAPPPDAAAMRSSELDAVTIYPQGSASCSDVGSSPAPSRPLPISGGSTAVMCCVAMEHPSGRPEPLQDRVERGVPLDHFRAADRQRLQDLDEGRGIQVFGVAVVPASVAASSTSSHQNSSAAVLAQFSGVLLPRGSRLHPFGLGGRSVAARFVPGADVGAIQGSMLKLSTVEQPATPAAADATTTAPRGDMPPPPPPLDAVSLALSAVTAPLAPRGSLVAPGSPPLSPSFAAADAEETSSSTTVLIEERPVAGHRRPLVIAGIRVPSSFAIVGASQWGGGAAAATVARKKKLNAALVSYQDDFHNGVIFSVSDARGYALIAQAHRLVIVNWQEENDDDGDAEEEDVSVDTDS